MLKHLAWLACSVATAGLVLGFRARAGALPVERPAGLIKADQNFENATAERGVEGWMEDFPQDSKMLPAGEETISGKRAIREAVAPLLATPEFSLRWKSVGAGISTSPDLGCTYRTFVSKPSTTEGQPVTRHGKCVTIWRKQADGPWKMVMDLGNRGLPSAVA